MVIPVGFEVIIYVILQFDVIIKRVWLVLEFFLFFSLLHALLSNCFVALHVFERLRNMDNKMNDIFNKMGAAKGLSLGVKLVAGVGVAAYGLSNSMFTGNFLCISSPFIARRTFDLKLEFPQSVGLFSVLILARTLNGPSSVSMLLRLSVGYMSKIVIVGFGHILHIH